ncbi:hypothetical protein QBC46DRAFT_339497 [Diplogelasinospora grovesii]|uniref:Uncharacterized protein n=1 Tax=Diplogelasinospora grovesii TaxID=303347 RepID=A0AAN6NB69_9PEZI|nr:hypothetical protein QBC46DRAFT_339497 [Diplogelasinospora grovesii]
MVHRQYAPRLRRRPSIDDYLHNDEGTLYSDEESIYSAGSTTSFDTCDSVDWQENPHPFYLDKEDGHKPVYEAWRIFPSYSKQVHCGVKVNQMDMTRTGIAAPAPEVYEQSELMSMHLAALGEFQAKNKRCWVSRVLRCGKSKTYEQDLDERCRKLPKFAQDRINGLLLDRTRTSSTRHRSRTWTVVVMRKQLCHRFSSATPEVVKRHKVRFWKNPPEPMLEYFVVIRGSETKACTDPRGFTVPEPHSNPWRDVDEAEFKRRANEERIRRAEERAKRRQSPPSYRSEASDADARRSVRSPMPRRSAPDSRRVRVPMREMPDIQAPNPFISHPNAPTPPRSYPTPPGVSNYRAPPPPPPPPPLHVEQPFATAPWASQPFYSYYSAPPPPPSVRPSVFTNDYSNDFTEPYNDLPTDRPAPPRSESFMPSCIACRNTPSCGHWGQRAEGTCVRPIIWRGEGAFHPYHPPCAGCLNRTPTPPPPFPAGYGTRGASRPTVSAWMAGRPNTWTDDGSETEMSDDDDDDDDSEWGERDTQVSEPRFTPATTDSQAEDVQAVPPLIGGNPIPAIEEACTSL